VERDKFDSVGGLAIHLTGRIPKGGDEIRSKHLLMTVLEADERKIKKLRISRIDATEENKP